MASTNPSLTPTGRLENLSDRVGTLRARVDGLRAREHLSRALGEDLTAVAGLLDRIDRDISTGLGQIHTISRFDDELCPRAKQHAHTVVLAQSPWINYADARLDAANIAFLALSPTRHVNEQRRSSRRHVTGPVASSRRGGAGSNTAAA